MPLAPIWAAADQGVITTSVERIKGLEFDACFVLGLEDVESAALNSRLIEPTSLFRVPHDASP